MKASFGTSQFLLAILIATSTTVNATNLHTLPQVDLGYAIYRPTTFNEEIGLYNFTNIRYARAPVGPLRFSAPQPPTGRNTTVDGGFIPRYCVSNTDFSIIPAFRTLQYDHRPFQKEYQTEDCLFLNVVVPQTIFERKEREKRPVVVWIHGGGFVQGNKDTFYDPSGLLERSENEIVFVSINYRLGIFSFLSGSAFRNAGGTPNAGLLDQRMAIEWVRDNIEKFGGDPGQITLMGESAGGGSIFFQITAYGGQRAAPFQRAIPQSGGRGLNLPGAILDAAYNNFLGNLNVTGLEDARRASWDAIWDANNKTIGNSYVGPSVDGSFIPHPLEELLTQGQFATNLKVLVGRNADEGSILLSEASVGGDIPWESFLYALFPTGPQSTFDKATELYPEIYNGSYPWTNLFEREGQIFADAVALSCGVNWLSKALAPFKKQKENAWAYMFSVPNITAAMHGFDIFSTFYNGPGGDNPAIAIPEVALTHQRFLVNFIRNGDPNIGAKVPHFDGYDSGKGNWMLNYTLNENDKAKFIRIVDPDVNPRCDWWETLDYPHYTI